MKRNTAQNTYIASLITLLSGTVIAQAIPILVSPVIARLYAPEQLGTLALFVALTAVLGVLATGRLELLLPIIRTDSEAFRLLCGAAMVALAVGALLLLMLALFSEAITALLNSPGLAGWLWLLPLSVVSMSLFQLLTYWCNRRRAYASIARSRVAQSGATAAAQVIAGYWRAGFPGLLLGSLLGQFVAIGRLLVVIVREERARFGTQFALRCLAVLRRHRHFPAFMIPGQIANVASLQVAVVLLGICYGHAIAGYYALAERVIIAPSAIVGTAVGDAFRAHAAEQYRNSGNCRKLYVRTSIMLAAFGAIAFLCLALGARWLFVFVFGPAWSVSGQIAAVMATLMFFQILSSPLSQTVYLANMQRLDMLWQFLRLFVAACALLVGYWIWDDYMVSIGLYVGATSVMYVAHSLMQYRAACGQPVQGAL